MGGHLDNLQLFPLFCEFADRPGKDPRSSRCSIAILHHIRWNELKAHNCESSRDPPEYYNLAFSCGVLRGSYTPTPSVSMGTVVVCVLRPRVSTSVGFS